MANVETKEAAGRSRRRVWVPVVLVVAIVAATVGFLKLRTDDDRSGTAPGAIAAPDATLAPTTSPLAPVPSTAAPPPPSSSPPSSSAAPTGRSGQAGGSSSAGPTSSAPPPEVVCQSNLSVADAPDAPYSFECTVGDAPITWPTGQLRLYRSGLDPLQALGLSVALVEFEAVAQFDVINVSSADEADVVITQAGLPNDENGYTTVHYTCDPACVYDHADVQLSTSAPLLESLWVSTVLHELGHVAGLAHVARASEVMYPLIVGTKLPVYSAGDTAGLRALADTRSRGNS